MDPGWGGGGGGELGKKFHLGIGHRPIYFTYTVVVRLRPWPFLPLLAIGKAKTIRKVLSARISSRGIGHRVLDILEMSVSVLYFAPRPIQADLL